MPFKNRRQESTTKPGNNISPTKNGQHQSQPAGQEATAWPAFNPLQPKEDLSLHHLVPGQICTVSNLWTPTLCKKYISFLSGLPLVTTPGQPKRGHAVRVNDRLQVHDAGFARRLWTETALSHLLLPENAAGHERQQQQQQQQKEQLWGGRALGLNPNIRVYRYTKGQFFAQHYDDSNAVAFVGEDGKSVRAKTTWTLLLYLSSTATGCVGGETVFYPESSTFGGKRGKKGEQQEPIVVELEVGMALLHKHGQDCMLHEGREVIEGEKWVIRSDLCVAA